MTHFKTLLATRRGYACFTTVVFSLVVLILGVLFDLELSLPGVLLSSLTYFVFMSLTFPILKRWQRT